MQSAFKYTKNMTFADYQVLPCWRGGVGVWWWRWGRPCQSSTGAIVRWLNIIMVKLWPKTRWRWLREAMGPALPPQPIFSRLSSFLSPHTCSSTIHAAKCGIFRSLINLHSVSFANSAKEFITEFPLINPDKSTLLRPHPHKVAHTKKMWNNNAGPGQMKV